MHGSHRQARCREAGFTLVEVTVAAFVLVVGLLGTISMLDNANLATASTKAREQGIALQRELIEAARSVPYDQLTPTSIVGNVQALPDLGDDEPGVPGWQIRRRGVTYTVTLGVCSVDDPADGQGTVDDSTFCASGPRTSAATCAALIGVPASVQGVPNAAGAGLAVGDCGLDLDLDGAVDELTRSQLAGHVDLCQLGLCTSNSADTQPDDYKRLVSLVTWDRGTGGRYALQGSIVPNPGSAAAPQLASLTAGAPLTVTSGSTLSFTATTSRPAAAVAWAVDGNDKGTATSAGSAWAFTWDLGTVSSGSSPNPGEVEDGVYVVGAQAFDQFGVAGETRSVTVTINRRAPYGPTDFTGGRDPGGSGGSDVVDFEWNPETARDIVGYRVYRQVAGGTDVQVCPATPGDTVSGSSCQASGQPSDPQLDYYAVAVDHDPSGLLREGAQSAVHTVTATDTPPQPPSNLTLTNVDGNVVLNWTASPGDPDPGDSVDFYRIYRDGTAFADRYDRTGTSAELTFTDTDTNALTHTYRVVAVDTQLAESSFSNAVTG